LIAGVSVGPTTKVLVYCALTAKGTHNNRRILDNFIRSKHGLFVLNSTLKYNKKMLLIDIQIVNIKKISVEFFTYPELTLSNKTQMT